MPSRALMPNRALLRAGLLPTARTTPLGTTAATVVLAGAPLVVVVARGGDDLTIALVVLALGVGTSTAWAVDDPAADILGAMPLSRPVQSAARVVVAAVTSCAIGTTGLLVAFVGPGLPAIGGRLLEGTAAAAIALACGFAAVRSGERMAGLVGLVAGFLGPVFIAVSAVRWPTHLPSFADDSLHNRWWLVVAVGTIATARFARDPGKW